MSSERSGLLKVLIAAMIWGSIPLLVRATSAHPAVIVFYRVFFAGTVLITYGLISGRLATLRSIPRRTLGALIVMGALLTLNWVLFFTAITLVEVSVAVLLAYCGPVFVAALGPLVNRTSFDRGIIVPLMLALGGTALIVGPDGVHLSGTAGLGALLAFSSAITYALLVVNAKRLIAKVDPIAYMSVEYGTATILLLPAVLLLSGPQGATEFGALATLGIVHTAVTGFLFLSALRIARADHVAIVTYAEPVSAVIFAAAFLGEPVSATTIVGGLAVLVGGTMVARTRAGASVEGPPLLIQAPDVTTDT